LRDEIVRLFATLGSEVDAAEARRALGGLLAAQRKSWSDIANLIRSAPSSCWPRDPEIRERIAKLVALLVD
jgi:hypothetical protein